VAELPTQAGLRSFALAKLAAGLPIDDQSTEGRFLRSFGTPGKLETYLNEPVENDRALLAVARELDLNPIEILATAIGAGVETDPIFGRAIAYLQRPLGGSRPTIGLLSSAFADLVGDGNVVGALLAGGAIESGLLQVLNENAPLAEHVLAVPVPTCLGLASRMNDRACIPWPGTTLDKGGAPSIPLPASILIEAEKHGKALAAGLQRSLVLRSGSPAEARAAATEIVKVLGRQAVFIDAEKDGRPLPVAPGLGPWLVLCHRIPVFSFELGPGERKALPVLPRYRGPQLATCGLEGTLESRGETIPGWTLPVPTKGERERLWEASVGSRTLAKKLAGHRHGSGRIAQLGRLARYQSVLEGRDRVQVQDIATASWTTEGAGLEALAQPLTHRIPDEALVMTTGLREELHRLLQRCRGREGLGFGLGVSAATRYHAGVRALFCGPSGTGKTLAAGWLATHLGLPLYRVDLASVTSKYIGETEKNLAQLLARAEHAEVVLLFDEADSMFGKRTDVKESNDRFANAQTNYLLQRIESFDGIVLLTSNSQSRFDPAFFRRLDAIIEFPVPGPSERRSLWQSHLGAHHSLSPREMNQLSATVELHGGSIRNAVLAAAVLARAESRQMTYRDVLRGLSDEYRKLGRQLPADLVKTAEPAKSP
jgi:hypothetical protein